MTEVENKIITVESLKALHDYNEKTFLKNNNALTTLGINTSIDELNYISGVTSSVQTQINNIQTNIDKLLTPVSVGTVSNDSTVNISYRSGNTVVVNLSNSETTTMTKDTSLEVATGFPTPQGVSDTVTYPVIVYMYNSDTKYISQGSINASGTLSIIPAETGDFSFIVNASYIITITTDS